MSAHLRLAEEAPASTTDVIAERPVAPISVVVADDRIVVRRMLRLLLDSEDGVQVVAEAGDIGSRRLQMNGYVPDVLVLDLQMPDGSSIEMIRGLREQSPKTEIVVLTMEASPVFARKALDAGALGFVLKEHADRDLPEAVRRAARGRSSSAHRLRSACGHCASMPARTVSARGRSRCCA